MSVSDAVAADALDDARARARALTELAPHAVDLAFEAVVATAEGSAFSRLVPHLRDDKIEAALTAALAFNRQDQAVVLGKLAPRLSPGQLDRALAGADAVGSPSARDPTDS